MFSFRKAQEPNPTLSTLVFSLEEASKSETKHSRTAFQNMNSVDSAPSGKIGLYKTQYVAQQGVKALPSKKTFKQPVQSKTQTPIQKNQKVRDIEIESTARKLLDRFKRNEKQLELLTQKYREMNLKLKFLESENKTHKTAISIYRDELKSKEQQIQTLKIDSLQLDK